MRDGEWSRSRFWHGHFLYSRHERPVVSWTGPADLPRALARPLCNWLAGWLAPEDGTDDWLIEKAVCDQEADPAYAQSLRLVARERHHHRHLVERLLQRLGPGRDGPPSGGGVPRLLVTVRRRLLGVRFELSVRLLRDLADLMVLAHLGGTCPDRAWRGAAATLVAEKRGHIMFLTERLTLLYADFNFVRRNLRRLRLRLMWLACLLHVIGRHGSLIRATGQARSAFLLAGLRHFARLLESMVPYRRDALLAALLNQRREPYAEPSRHPLQKSPP